MRRAAPVPPQGAERGSPRRQACIWLDPGDAHFTYKDLHSPYA